MRSSIEKTVCRRSHQGGKGKKVTLRPTKVYRDRSETAAMLFWALLASGQITMRKVDGWQTLATKPTDAVIDLAA